MENQETTYNLKNSFKKAAYRGAVGMLIFYALSSLFNSIGNFFFGRSCSPKPKKNDVYTNPYQAISKSAMIHSKQSTPKQGVYYDIPDDKIHDIQQNVYQTLRNNGWSKGDADDFVSDTSNLSLSQNEFEDRLNQYNFFHK